MQEVRTFSRELPVNVGEFCFIGRADYGILGFDMNKEESDLMAKT
jgi:hypothetical protein